MDQFQEGQTQRWNDSEIKSVPEMRHKATIKKHPLKQ